MYLDIQNNPYGDNKKDLSFKFHILYFNSVNNFQVIKKILILHMKQLSIIIYYLHISDLIL